MTGFSIFSSLIYSLTDEQNYTEILNYDWNSINFFKEILVYQNDILVKSQSAAEFHVKAKIVKKIEIIRIIGIMKCYHKNRMWKIENFLTLDKFPGNLMSRISKSEEIFTISYKNLLFTYQFLLFNDFSFKYRIVQIKEFNETKKKKNFILFRLFEKKTCSNPKFIKLSYIIKLTSTLTFCMKYSSIKYLAASKIIFLV
jgi:hypothetical protein